jgi:hypothetical protein
MASPCPASSISPSISAARSATRPIASPCRAPVSSSLAGSGSPFKRPGSAWRSAPARPIARWCSRSASTSPGSIASSSLSACLLAAFAGMIAAPVASVYPGMGNQILIVSFVVVVIGGIGSIKGAFLGSLLIGLADTFGQVLAPQWAGMTVYVLMAAVLLWRPAGLFGGSTPSDEPAESHRAGGAGGARLVSAAGGDVLSPARRQDHDHGDLRHEPRSAGGLCRPRQLRPCGVLRHRRLCADGIVAAIRRRQSLAQPAHRHDRRGIRRAGDRAFGAALLRRLFHHGDAGLRADVFLLRHRQQIPRRLRRRLHLCEAERRSPRLDALLARRARSDSMRSRS